MNDPAELRCCGKLMAYLRQALAESTVGGQRWRVASTVWVCRKCKRETARPERWQRVKP